MGKNSGGGGGASSGGVTPAMRAKYGDAPALAGIKDPAVRDSIIQAMHDIDKEFGLNSHDVVLKKMTERKYAQASYHGKTELNSQWFKDKDKLVAQYKKDVENNYSYKSKDPVRSIVAHELSHTIDPSDNYRNRDSHGVSASEHLNRLYNDYKRSGSSTLGRYATTNKHEFFAEAISKHLTGKKDEWTTKVYNFAKTKWRN